ncbi:MAG: hypothetical protein AAFQ63_22745, partial [Cyanobacteria bacterium J06621_11]
EVALEEASDTPDSVDVLALWRQFERELSDLPQRDRLRVAGDILMELAGLCETKADLLWEDWQDEHNTEGPVMGGDWLSGLTRQTQELDFSGLVQRSYRTEERADTDDIDESIVGAVEKASALALADVLDEQMLKTQALSVSHAENVSDWVAALLAVQTAAPQRLISLQAQLKMPLSELWLAALLGGFTLEQRGGFYETAEVWVGDKVVS